ncbi:CPBP family intramembrane metalloprotease [Marine Group III euryarchaeote]|nr:CPBP family intramembrane metalloprotease [Marine Group III euryarchaeote]
MAYLFILILLSILVQPFLGLLLWVLAALILYSLADQYGRDVPWIQKLLEDLEFKYSETYESVTESTINDGGNEDKSIIEKTGDSAKYYSNKISEDMKNYSENFNEWRNENIDINKSVSATSDYIQNFSFNSPGFYTLRLWLFIIIFPIGIWWIGILGIVSQPIYVWYNILGFTTFQAENMAAASTLGLSMFLTIRIYSHCTNNRTLPINSEIFSDYDTYTLRHLFQMPRRGSFSLTTKSLFLQFIIGWIIIIAIFGVETFEGIVCNPEVLNNLNDVDLDFLTLFTLLLYVSILTPVVEEVVFRGFVLDLASERYGDWFSIFISAFLFAIVHVAGVTVVNAFIAGLIFGYLRIRTGSLWPPIIVHFLWNTHLYLIEIVCI